MRNNFSQNYHLPILCLLLVTGWVMIGIRIWSFRRQKRQTGGWRSFAGVGVGLSVAAGITATVYVALTIATFALDQKLFNFYDRTQNYPNEVLTGVEPFKATDAQCQWIINQVIPMMKMTWASRFFLTAALWFVKGSLLAIYLQSRIALSKGLRFALYAMAVFIVGTFVVAVIILYEKVAAVFTYPTIADVRAGAFMGGITYTELDDKSELIITCMNLGTDVLLTFFAYRIITSLRLNINYSSGTSWFLLLMSSITVSVAIIRVSFVIVSYRCMGNCQEASVLAKLMMPIMVMNELEAFSAIVVSCLPALRAVIRSGRESGTVESDRSSLPQMKVSAARDSNSHKRSGSMTEMEFQTSALDGA